MKSTNASKARFLLGAVERPKGSKLRLVVGHPAAEQVLEAAAGLVERVALHIEEDVARRGLRKQRESERRRVLAATRRSAVAPSRPRTCSDGLAAQLGEGLRVHAVRARVVGCVRQRGDARDAGVSSSADLDRGASTRPCSDDRRRRAFACSARPTGRSCSDLTLMRILVARGPRVARSDRRRTPETRP